MVTDPRAAIARLKAFVDPWHESLRDPAAAQQTMLKTLLQGYAQTDYGKQHGAARVESIADYRRAFPVGTYETYKPMIDRVMAGEGNLLLYEPVLGWAITRGTTGKEPKFIPMTPTDMRSRASAGRAMLNYVLGSSRFALLQGVNLNLNFPSVVGKIKVGQSEVEYGYSSGIYVKHVAAATPIRSLPTQEDIDKLGGGKSIRDWEERFELAYQQCKTENVTLVGGVAPTAVLFGQYLRRRHRVYPKDVWKVQIMTLGSVPGINTRYEPVLKALYGPQIAIREIYGATEGMFGQQLDERRAWTPNYDLFFFEVATRSGVKMLHEMQPGETGSLVVSTSVLPRYRIGDIVMAFAAPYFRCIGRENWWTPLAYYWRELTTMNLGRL